MFLVFCSSRRRCSTPPIALAFVVVLFGAIYAAVVCVRRRSYGATTGRLLGLRRNRGRRSYTVVVREQVVSGVGVAEE